ncbi:MAG: serine/threonine-protein kinase [Cyanobacteriota bacterium]|nr:serine/threonine-protein kinase [Cyanobacteriota bacterium]
MAIKYCINPKCSHRENSDDEDRCRCCGADLLIGNRYNLIRPLRPPLPGHPTEIFEVEDWGKGEEDWGTFKVMKVLKYNNNPDLVRLFKQEARALMWLRNPGIPKIEPDGYFTVDIAKPRQTLHCLVMEKIEGENLEAWIEQHGAISEEEALEWLEQLVNILDLVHSQNLLHRDIKPSNIIVRPNGQLAAIDFGTVGVGEGGRTQVGSLGYAAPEQMTGEAVFQSDFFALGRTFVHLLTGRSPMDFPTKTAKLTWRKNAPLVSKSLGDLIDDLMEENYRKRPKNTRFILKRLQTVTRNEKTDNFSTILASLKWQWVGLLFLGLIGSRFLLPKVGNLWQEFALPHLATTANKLGRDNFKKNELASAEFYFRVALMLDKDNAKAVYNLGWVCEEISQFDCAKTQYQKALQNENPRVVTRAINNLARLHILEGNYNGAAALLWEGLNSAEHPFIADGVKSDLHKNLGWVYFQREEYAEAESHLQRAIALDKENTPAYCLLAQVRELGDNNNTALSAWNNCLESPSGFNPETQIWQTMARQRLN